MTTRRSDAPPRSSDTATRRGEAPDYESRRAVDQYLLFHYGSTEEVLPYLFGPRDALGYPARCARAALDDARETPRRALDLGCAVGGATFELARDCTEVVGIDLSRAFVAAADALRRDGSLPYARVDEGDRTTQLVARVPQGIDRSRVRFEVGDATALPSDLGVFDVVVLANLIDRVGDPRRCLEQAGSLVRPGGVLFVSSPYTWLVEATPRDRWLGGRAGGWSSFETLRTLLEPSFELLHRRDMPFLLREHARKYQWSVAEATTWQRS